MDALGDGTRRRILERLRSGPCAVGGSSDGLPVSPPAVSQPLRVFEQASLVSARSEGTRRIYVLDPDGLGSLRTYFDEFWNDFLGSFKEAVEGTG